jgi:hypothetical protein
MAAAAEKERGNQRERDDPSQSNYSHGEVGSFSKIKAIANAESQHLSPY